MSDVVMASDLLRDLAKPRGEGEYIKTTIDRVSKLAKLGYWRAFDLWYKKARTVEEYELDQIRDALRIKKESAARNELHDLKLRLTRLEASLSSGDSDFYSPSIDHARDMVRQLGRQDRPVARRLKPETHIGFDPPSK